MDTPMLLGEKKKKLLKFDSNIILLKIATGSNNLSKITRGKQQLLATELHLLILWQNLKWNISGKGEEAAFPTRDVRIDVKRGSMREEIVRGSLDNSGELQQAIP